MAKKRKKKKNLKKLIRQRLQQIPKEEKNQQFSISDPVEVEKPKSKEKESDSKKEIEKSPQKSLKDTKKSDLIKIGIVFAILIVIGIIFIIINLKTNFLEPVANKIFDIFNRS